MAGYAIDGMVGKQHTMPLYPISTNHYSLKSHHPDGVRWWSNSLLPLFSSATEGNPQKRKQKTKEDRPIVRKSTKQKICAFRMDWVVLCRACQANLSIIPTSWITMGPIISPSARIVRYHDRGTVEHGVASA